MCYCITRRSGTVVERFGLTPIGLVNESLLGIAQFLLSATQTTPLISFWKEFISSIPMESCELEGGVKVRPWKNAVCRNWSTKCIRWALPANVVIIHQTPYEKSDWSRAFNQFTIACELVTTPLGVFSSETKWLNASLLFLRLNYVKNV